MVKVTVAVPVYNEPEDIEPFIRAVEKELEGMDYEIVIAEDGSNDAPGIIKRMKAKRCRVLHSDERLGKGGALGRAIRESDCEIFAYMDVDLSSDIRELKRLISGVEKETPISTGSRLMPGSKTKRGFTREFAGRSFNFLVRLLLGSKVRDHPCGFKAFRRKDILPILDQVKDTRWFWDTELLVKAQRAGLKVDEFPIEWSEKGESKVRIFNDAKDMGLGILRLMLGG